MRAIVVSVLVGIAVGFAIYMGLWLLFDAIMPAPVSDPVLWQRSGCTHVVAWTCQGWTL